MTKRRWALAAMLATALLLLFAYHYLAYRADRNPMLDYLEERRVAGRWRTHNPAGAVPALTPEQNEEIANLETMGYLAGSVPAPDAQGVTQYDETRAFNGLNLLVSGHASEAVLMDMRGMVLHTWQRDFFDIPWGQDVKVAGRGYERWRRVHLFENGDLLAIFEGYGLVKLDKDSTVLWARPVKYHHDLEVLEDGTICVLSREARIVPRLDEDFPVLLNFVSILDADGNERRRIPLLEAFENSEYRPILDSSSSRKDMFHANTIEYLDGSLSSISPAYRRGNLLLCIRELHAIAILDPETERIVWATRGPWHAQHQSTLLPDGHMLLFDNEGLRQHRSRVLEFDPFTLEIFWSYGDAPAETLYSNSCGSCQRLPNGNTLITESDNGRALEVTPDKTVVWEFVSPYRAGEKQELIATLFEVVRLAPDFPLDWLESKPVTPP